MGHAGSIMTRTPSSMKNFIRSLVNNVLGYPRPGILWYWYTPSWQQVESEWSTHLFFTFDYRTRCKGCVRCMHAYSNIKKLPSRMKFFRCHCFPMSWDHILRFPNLQGWELGFPRMIMGIHGHSGTSQYIHSHPGISRWEWISRGPLSRCEILLKMLC